MGAFQQLRDSSMMPLYEGTLNFTRMRDPDPQSIALLKGVLTSPGLARAWAYALPSLISQTLPPPLYERVQGFASAFAGDPAPVSVPPIPVD
jgi:hypothetical protein